MASHGPRPLAQGLLVACTWCSLSSPPSIAALRGLGLHPHLQHRLHGGAGASGELLEDFHKRGATLAPHRPAGECWHLLWK